MIIAYDVDIPATGIDNFVNETSIDKESTLFITVVPMIVATEFDIRVSAVKHEWAAKE